MVESLAGLGADFEIHYRARSPQRAAFPARIKQSRFALHVRFHFDDGPPEQMLDIPARCCGRLSWRACVCLRPEGFP